RSPGQPPEDEGAQGPPERPPRRGFPSQARHVPQRPGDLRGRVVRAEPEPGPLGDLADAGRGAAGDAGAEGRASQILPGVGWRERAARVAVPEEDRRALRGHAEARRTAGVRGRARARGPGRALEALDRAPQDLLGLLLDAPAGTAARDERARSEE